MRFVEDGSEQPVAAQSLRVDVFRADWSRRRAYVLQADGDGAVEMHIPTDVTRLVLRNHLPAPYVAIQVEWDQEDFADLPDEFALRIQRGSSVGGVVRDEFGAPVPGAQLSLQPVVPRLPPRQTLTAVRARTDVEGRWRADGLPVNLESATLRLSHPNYFEGAAQEATASPSVGALRGGTATSVMEKGFVVKGRVRDTLGDPVAGALVRMKRDGAASVLASTNDEGLYRFHCRGSEFQLAVRAKGFAPSYQTRTFGGGDDEVDFVLDPGETIGGQVVDREGTPIAGVSFDIRVSTSTEILWNGQTDEHGRFAWDSAPRTEVELGFYKNGYPQTRIRSSGPGADHRIILD